MIFAPRNLPRIPTATEAAPAPEARTARPVRGVTPAALADYANHLAGYRRLRVVSMFIEGAVDAATHYTIQLSGETWMRWTTGLLATHIWLAITYNTLDAGATGGEPQLEVALEEPDGTVIDAGILFRRDNGSLPAFHENARLGPGFTGVSHIYTPPRPSAADGGTQTGPRPLVLPAPGSDVSLHLNWVHCRVYSVTAIEMYREVIG